MFVFENRTLTQCFLLLSNPLAFIWYLSPRLSYEALGLLTSIPLSQSATASSSKPSSQPLKDADLISGFGRIVRDAEGNVIDVILPEDDEEAAADDSEDEDELDAEGRVVPAKTEVVKSESQDFVKGLNIALFFDLNLTLRSIVRCLPIQPWKFCQLQQRL